MRICVLAMILAGLAEVHSMAHASLLGWDFESASPAPYQGWSVEGNGSWGMQKYDASKTNMLFTGGTIEFSPDEFPFDASAVSPPFQITDLDGASIGFHAQGRFDPEGAQSDSCVVSLERAIDAVEVDVLQSWYGVTDFGIPGKLDPNPTWNIDVSEIVEPNEFYRVRFRAYDYDDLPSMYYVALDNLQVEGAESVPGGDANFDGRVDGGDYTSWADNYLQPDRSWLEGDFTGDGRVDTIDYKAWEANYSPAAPATAVAVVIPEPSTMVLAALGVCSLFVSGSRVRSRFARR